jgi:Kef-type K+ transport system membrane component KefB
MGLSSVLPASWQLGTPLAVVGLLVLVALIGGELARALRLPPLVGYSATGIGLGAAGLLPLPLAPELRAVLDVSLGLVLFELGARIDLGWLRRAPWLAVQALVESAGVGLVLYALLTRAFGLASDVAACCAAIGVSTSPAVSLRIARDLEAQGQVTERMLLLSATNSAVAVLAASLLGPALAATPEGNPWIALSHPFHVVIGSLALAAVVAIVGLGVFRVVGKSRESQLVVALGVVVLATGLAPSLGLSAAFTSLALGAGLRSLDRHEHVLAIHFGKAGQLFYVLLFTLAGASLDPKAGLGAVALVLAYLAARAAAKGAAVLLFARPTRQPLRQAGLLALALQPMSGLAVVLATDTALVRPDLASSVVPLVLGSVLVLELLGPLCTQQALRWAGEAAPAAA